MPQPNSSQVHANTPLSNISIAFLQNATNFVASKVFPAVPVSKQSDRYYTYERGDFNRDEMQKRAPGTESAGSGYNVDNTPTYFADVWALHRDIDEQIRRNADTPLNLDREATEFLTHKALIRKEKIFAANYLTTGVWTTDRTGVASSPSGVQFLQWNDSNSNPLSDLRAGITTVHESTGFQPNVLVLGQQVWDNGLFNHPDIVDRIKYGTTDANQAVVTLSALAQLIAPDVPNFRIMLMAGVENTAKEGQTPVHRFINGKNALLAYAAPRPGLMTPSAGYDFQWRGLLRGTNFTQIKRYPMRHLNSERVEIEMAFDLKLVAADLGYFFSAAVA